MSSLLTTDSPIIILPSLATAFGIPEAALLQQIHYLALNPKKGLMHQGRKWVYNTLEQWHAKFCCWSMATIERAIAKLRQLGVIHVERLGPHKTIRTNYYRIDYAKLAHLPEVASAAACLHDPSTLTESSPQNEGISDLSMREINPADCGDHLTKKTKENSKNSSKEKTGCLNNRQQHSVGSGSSGSGSSGSGSSGSGGSGSGGSSSSDAGGTDRMSTVGATHPTIADPKPEQLQQLDPTQRQLWQQLRHLRLDIAHDDPRLTLWSQRRQIKTIVQTLLQLTDQLWRTPEQLGFARLGTVGLVRQCGGWV